MTHIAQRKPLTLAAMPRTMTSLEIATLTGKDHKHVLRDIRAMLLGLYPNPDKVYDPDVVGGDMYPDLSTSGDSEVGSDPSRPHGNVSPSLGSRSVENWKLWLHPDAPDFGIEVEVPGPNGAMRSSPAFVLDREHALTLTMGYSAVHRFQVVQRWVKMEDSHAQFRADIQTLSTSPDREASWTAALRLAQKQLLGATNQKALKAIRSALENGSHPGASPASIATATLEFYNKNAAKLQKLETPDASTTLSMLKAFDLASDSPARRLSQGQTEAQAWS